MADSTAFDSPAINMTLASTSKLAKTPGKMHLQGKIIEAACYVDHDDQQLLVEFHNISARDISNAPENISAHDFSIHLLGCSLEIHNIQAVYFIVPASLFTMHHRAMIKMI